MRESGEHGVGFGGTELARDVLHDTVNEFYDRGVVEAYVAALEREAASRREEALSRLAQSEYPILARRSDHVAGAHPDNGRYFLAMIDPETGEEILALPTDGRDLPIYADSPDSLVWVCTVTLKGEVSVSQSFDKEQAMVVIAHAQAAEEAGIDPTGRQYLDLNN